MTRKWFFHPILFFVFSIIALGVSYFLYIYWYIEISAGLESIARRFNLEPGQIFKAPAWVVILVLTILVGIIMLGIFTIFVFNQKTLQLYRLQDNFINNFTHELKTPVTSLKLFLETLFKHELSREDQQKYINFMIHDVDQLSDNINRILNLARIETKSYTGEFTVLNLIQFVERFCEKNKHLFTDCQIHIHNPSGKTFLYRINPSFFEMLLMNLFINAIKYNESGAPRIDITFESGKKKLKIYFQDNGIGIAKNEYKKIFKKFYQIGRAENMSAKGSGVGLFIVQTIARIHKGKVFAESEGIGKGSVFTLILPHKECI